METPAVLNLDTVIRADWSSELLTGAAGKYPENCQLFGDTELHLV